MNKKIVIGVGIAVFAIAITIVGLKTTLGDKVTELPGEENTESTLHLQESNTTANATTQSTESGSTESSESGP